MYPIYTGIYYIYRYILYVSWVNGGSRTKMSANPLLLPYFLTFATYWSFSTSQGQFLVFTSKFCNFSSTARQPQEVGKKKSYVQNTVFSFFFFLKTDFVFGVWRKGCVSVWFSNCEIQDFNRQWSSALICIFSSREIMSSLWIDGGKVILWWINLFSPVYGDENNEKKLFFVHCRSWHLIHVITRLFRLPAKVKWEMLCETWNRHSFHIASHLFFNAVFTYCYFTKF